MNARAPSPPQVDIDSPQAAQILGTLTKHPCSNPDHRGQGYSTLLFAVDEEGQPVPRFTNEQVLFFACRGCKEEARRASSPNCPPEHRPHRYAAITHDNKTKTTVTVSGCHACSQEETYQ